LTTFFLLLKNYKETVGSLLLILRFNDIHNLYIMYKHF